MRLNPGNFCQCDKCWKVMGGILSYNARRTCEPCGGVALNVWGDRTNLGKYKMKTSALAYRPMPPPGKRRA